MMNEEQDFCARCLQLDDECKCYELDKEKEQDSDLCPVCQDFPIPEFQGCSCWLCRCMTTNPAARTLCSCGQVRPSDVESVTRRLVAMANKMERIPATADWGSVATLREAIDLLRTHAFSPNHPLSLD
jgi:hypothetical protein